MTATKTLKGESGKMMTVIETEARAYPGTVLTGLSPKEFDELLVEKLAEGNHILRSDREAGLLHISLSTWEEARERLSIAGATVIGEDREEGYFLTLDQADAAVVPLELLAETILDTFKVLQPGESEKITLTVPNPGPGPVYIRRIAIEGVRLSPELKPPVEEEE